jgi:hypothetical protein
MTKQMSDSNLKDKDYRKWVEGQSTAMLVSEFYYLESERAILLSKDPRSEQDEQCRHIQEMKQKMLSKINEKDPKKRAKARAEVESIIDEDLAKGPEWIDDRAMVNLKIAVVQHELQARRIQELSKGKADSASAGARKLRKTDPAVAARRAVVQANADLRAPKMCAMLDDKEIPLPDREQWDSFRSHDNPWTEAYRTGGKKFRRRIRVIISKDKKT